MWSYTRNKKKCGRKDMIKVLPSSNPCPEDKLIDYTKMLMKMDVEYLHCDVMDGKFVENKCLDFSVVEKIRNNTNILLDVHLMVENVFESVKKFAKLKPNFITIHYEALKSTKEFEKIVKYLRKKDILVGLSIRPNTPIEIVERFLKQIDLILIMSVEPGKSGQKFIENSIEKIKTTKQLIGDNRVIIEVDGGINEENAKSVINAGAEFLVMGSAFYNSKDKLGLLHSIDKHYKKSE